jgi:hypothetical protein
MQGQTLNPYQKTSVTTALHWLEKALYAIEETLAADRRGTLYRVSTQLSSEQMRVTRELIEAMRQEIATTARELGLQAREEDGRRAIVAQLASAWEGLEDAKSAKLVRYGAVDPSLKDSLDPHLDKLIALVLQLEHLVASGSLE